MTAKSSFKRPLSSYSPLFHSPAIVCFHCLYLSSSLCLSLPIVISDSVHLMNWKVKYLAAIRKHPIENCVSTETAFIRLMQRDRWCSLLEISQGKKAETHNYSKLMGNEIMTFYFLTITTMWNSFMEYWEQPQPQLVGYRRVVTSHHTLAFIDTQPSPEDNL